MTAMTDLGAAEEGAEPAATLGIANAGGIRTVLNVGCGYPLRQRLHQYFQGAGWREIRLDVDPGCNPDILCSITDMSPVASDAVDAVWSSHNLEHIHRHEVPAALAEFYRVLKPAGLLLLTLPDLQQVAEMVAADRLDDEAYMSPSGPVTPLDTIFGHTASLAQGYAFMAHKTGFTLRSLRRLLEEAGFIDLRVQRGRNFDLWARALKPSGH